MNKHAYLVSELMGQLKLKYHQAIAVVGSLMQESSKSLKTNTLGTADDKGSYGIAQWHSERLTGLKNFARKQNKNWTDFDAQVGYLIHELKTTHKSAYRSIARAKDVKQASIAFTDKFERPSEAGKVHSKRISFANATHNYLKKQNFNPSQNYKPMASIKDPIEPTPKKYTAAQAKAVGLEMFKQSRKLQKNPDAYREYFKMMRDQGVLQVNSDGTFIGPVADVYNSERERFNKKGEGMDKARTIGLRAFGEVMKEGVTNPHERQLNNGMRVGGSDALPTKGKRAIQFNKSEKITKILNKAFSDVDKIDGDDRTVRNMITRVAKKLNSTSLEAQKEGLLLIEKNYTELTGKKAEFFNVDKNGKLTAGKDIDPNNDFFAFQLNEKNFNVENPTPVSTAAYQIPAPVYIPEIDEDATDFVDGDIDMSDASLSEPDPFMATDINYSEREVNPVPALNEKEDAARKIATELGLAQQLKADAERKANAKTKTEQEKEDQEVRTSQSVWNLEGLTPEKSFDPKQLKGGPLPIAEVAGGLAGLVMGKDMMDEPDVMRDERINSTYLSYLMEQRRISEMGMNPSDEAAAKNAMTEAYQIGIQNITRASGGNRNLILGNMANLDHSNATNLMKLSMEDAKIKQASFEAYGKAMEVVNDFEAKRGIENNTRKYQKALQKQAAGASLYSSAFKSMTDAISGYDAPDSANNMFKVKQHIDLWGFSPLVKDDGSGNTFGSYSYYQKNDSILREASKRKEFLNSKLDADSPEARKQFYKDTKGMTQNQQMVFAEKMYGNENGSTNASTVVQTNPETGEQEQYTTGSKATVPMAVENVPDGKGGMVSKPAQITTPDPANPSALNQDPNTPNVNPLVETASQGPTQVPLSNIQKQQESKPFSFTEYARTSGQGDNATTGIFAKAMGLEKEFDLGIQTDELLKPFGENKEDRYSFLNNIIKSNK